MIVDVDGTMTRCRYCNEPSGARHHNPRPPQIQKSRWRKRQRLVSYSILPPRAAMTC